MRTRMIDGEKCRYVKIGENIKIGDYWQYLIEGRVVYKREEGEHFGWTRNKYHWNVWRPLRAKAKAKVLGRGWALMSGHSMQAVYLDYQDLLNDKFDDDTVKRVKIVEAT